MLLSLTGNNKPIKKWVVLQKPLKESSEAMALHCNNSLDGLYSNKNDVKEIKDLHQLQKARHKMLCH